MRIKLKLLLAGIILSGWNVQLLAQSKNYSRSQMEKEPVWIEMMRDSETNYYQTLEAFRIFWDKRPLPREPFEAEEMETFEREVGLIREGDTEEDRERKNRRRWRKMNTTNQRDYAAEVRAFKGWMQHVKPWILEDGTIMTLQKQQEIINQQQQELKAVEKKSGKRP